MNVTRTSQYSGITRTLDLPVTQGQLDEFVDPNSRRLVQEIFPDLSMNEREFLMTGITQEEWDELFPEEEE